VCAWFLNKQGSNRSKTVTTQWGERRCGSNEWSVELPGECCLWLGRSESCSTQAGNCRRTTWCHPSHRAHLVTAEGMISKNQHKNKTCKYRLGNLLPGLLPPWYRGPFSVESPFESIHCVYVVAISAYLYSYFKLPRNVSTLTTICPKKSARRKLDELLRAPSSALSAAIQLQASGSSLLCVNCRSQDRSTRLTWLRVRSDSTILKKAACSSVEAKSWTLGVEWLNDA